MLQLLLSDFVTEVSVVTSLPSPNPSLVQGKKSGLL
jgi:hypothetical protein